MGCSWFPGRYQIQQLKAELGRNFKQIQDLEWRLYQLQKTEVGRVVASQALIGHIQQQIQILRVRNSWIDDHLNQIS